MDFVAALTGDRKRRAELPSAGILQAGGVVNVIGLLSLGIKQHLVPADDGEFVRGRGTGGESAFQRGGREEIEIGVRPRSRPAGTSTWMVQPSSRSRRHFSVLPPAVNFSPARSMTGPSGACSPGIHLG